MFTSSNMRSKLGRAGLLTSLGLLLSGCGALRDDAGRPLTTLNPKGENAEKIDQLIEPVFLVAAVVFVLVEVGGIWLAIKFRKRKNKESGEEQLDPIQTHGNPRLEWAWTILPAVGLAILAVFNVQTIWELEEIDDDAIMVEVVGQQWWWEFRYDLDSDGAVDIITANQMVIPADREVELAIKSRDVIHSFWIPELNGKKDAVPGHINEWSLKADEPGVYQGTCTEFCGLSHGFMRMEVKALSAADYEQWTEDQTEPAAEPAEGSLAAEGKDIFFVSCATCHQINGYDNTGEETDGTPDGDYRGDDHPLTASNAPNLTHLMSRDKFAGNIFDLYTEDENGDVIPDEVTMGEWLRNPDLMKEAAADQNRGMPNLGLTESQIQALVAYLTQLK